jgi:site-specific DNA-cytosine methylase
MIAGLTSALANNITVKFVTLIEKNKTVRFLANTRLMALHHQHPTLLPMSAISKPFQLQQDVTLLNAASFKGLEPATFIFATPPCQAFSTAGPMLGWE